MSISGVGRRSAVQTAAAGPGPFAAMTPGFGVGVGCMTDGGDRTPVCGATV
jgi:hypothetical protein